MSRAHGESRSDGSIIALDRFIQATRDSGYKGTSSAISELVDNSIQAGANTIAITVASVENKDVGGIEVSIFDDGVGMDPFTLRQALRFGGSSRFGDRSGMGRYGMGLPNASLSQARRVTVFTWQSERDQDRDSGRVFSSYLDVDEIVRREMEEVPVPKVVRNPPSPCVGTSGTFIVWSRCDRLDNRRSSTVVKKLQTELGRRFRHYIWKGLKLTINDEPVRAFDPLYLNRRGELAGAQQFGEVMHYEVPVNPADPTITGWVRVKFAELPVHDWHSMSNEEKRRIGISKGAGVSVVRAGREVDYGWFFMGGKRRENYDDWWRCEVQFDPILDEAFGITHTKQQVRPQPHLLEAISEDLETTARTLNARARKAHLGVKVAERFAESETTAERLDEKLAPLPKRPSAPAKELMKDLERRHPVLRRPKDAKAPSAKYRVIEESIKDTSFFTYAYDGQKLALVINPQHPFYKEVYRPLVESELPLAKEIRAKLELVLLSAVRSEAMNESAVSGKMLAQHRKQWSETLATFLSG